jgi:hypothetical protein
MDCKYKISIGSFVGIIVGVVCTIIVIKYIIKENNTTSPASPSTDTNKPNPN